MKTELVKPSVNMSNIAQSNPGNLNPGPTFSLSLIPNLWFVVHKGIIFGDNFFCTTLFKYAP